MSEQNPYIVREEEGKAATIRDFVTGVPLKPEEMLPDEHGIHPVSPLGFLNKDDGTALGVHADTTGFMPYKEEGVDYETASQLSYVVEGKYSIYEGDAISFPVLSLTRTDSSRFVVLVDGLVPTREMQEFFFRNASSDDYSNTGLVSDSYRVSALSFSDDGVNSTIELPCSNVVFSGIVGAGKLHLCVYLKEGQHGEQKRYLCVQNGDTVEHTGIFALGTGPGDPFRKMYECEHFVQAANVGSFDLLIAYKSMAWNFIDVKLADGSWEKLVNETYGGQTCPPDYRRDEHIFYSGPGRTNCTKIHIDNAELVNGVPVFRTWCWNSNENYGPYQTTDSGVASDPIQYHAYDPLPYPSDMSFVNKSCIDEALESPTSDALFMAMNDAWSMAGKSESNPPNDFYFWIFNIKQESGCYASNGYSDREVADWVNQKLGPVIGHAKHPYSTEGKLDGAGAFSRWFASCGDVDISGGAGSKQVNIPGFGLGAGYTGKCSSVAYDWSVPEKGLEPGGKWLTFGYGTKHDAVQTEVGKTALPLDWPFTDVVTGVDESTENNITLSRDGVEAGGTLYGRLAKYDECATCGGTGEVSGETCPDCCGTGYAKTGTLMNRVHVCLFNDFTPSDSTHGHVEDTTVLKKTFVNLAAPLDTEDGDEYEVTVSLPNINLPEAFPVPSEPGENATPQEIAEYETALRKNQSGYYAFVSQPRVYVVGGTWNFSDSRVEVDNPVTGSSAEDTATVTSFAIKEAFEGIPDGTRIRATVVSSGYPSEETGFTGVVNGTTVTLDCGHEVTFRRGLSYTICGAAYVEPNNGTLPEGSTPIGLNNARREGEGELGPDYGNGEGIQVYNRMYGVDDEGREQVIANSDKRQVVATVYPTVTNTFAWELSGSKTLNRLDSLMTMAAEDGASSIMSRIAWMNRNILKKVADAAGETFSLSPEQYPVDLDRVTAPDGSDGYSYIASVIQLAQAAAGEDGTLNEESNPVRQALRAVGMLAEDYRNARARTGELHVGQDDVFTSEPSMVDRDWAGMFTSTYSMSGNADDVAARSVRLRNLAPVVSGTAAGDDLGPLSPILGMHPYVWDDGNTRTVSSYHAGNPYGYSEYSSTDAVQEAPCDFVNDTYGKAYVGNSAAIACLAAHPSWLDDADSRDDLLRAVEIAAMDLGNDVLSTFNAASSAPWLRPFNAFACLVSPDNIPVPPAGAPGDLDTDEMKWYGGDAYGYYAMLRGVTGSNWGLIATEMGDTEPELTGLAAFLANYVPSYGADLPVRNWDSFRVRVKKTGQVTTDPVYLTRMAWYGNSCGGTFRGRYVSDAFIGSDGYEDVNLNTTHVSERAANYSSTPYALGGGFDPSRGTPVDPFSTDTDQGCVAYIRVFMKFTFSADAGRWYCTDYRQAPVSYLTPLYGAQALEEKIGDSRIWTAPSCSSFGWKEATRHLYGEYRPMDINPALVGEVMAEEEGVTRLMQPFKSVDNGGLGLSAPYNKQGNTWMTPVDAQRANFWSVRENLRPAASVLLGTNIPSYSAGVYGDIGGIMSDAVLWGQYDYPEKGVKEYHLPDTEVPEADLTIRRMIYAMEDPDTGDWVTGDIAVRSPGETPQDKALSISNGSGHN